MPPCPDGSGHARDPAAICFPSYYQVGGADTVCRHGSARGGAPRRHRRLRVRRGGGRGGSPGGARRRRCDARRRARRRVGRLRAGSDGPDRQLRRRAAARASRQLLRAGLQPRLEQLRAPVRAGRRQHVAGGALGDVQLWVGGDVFLQGRPHGGLERHGWVGRQDGTTHVRQFALNGKAPSMVVADRGFLVSNNRDHTVLVKQAKIYIAFQLKFQSQLKQQQCFIGYAICSACHGMLLNKDKCHVCSITGGYNGCIVLEKILESVQAACSNTKYGYAIKTHYHKHQVASPISLPLFLEVVA